MIIYFFSVPVGILLSEISITFFGGQWFRAMLAEVGGKLHEFQRATGDDVRQELLLRTGKMTLQFSFTVLGVILVLGGIAFLPPWMLDCDEAQQMSYVVAVSVVATVWWLIRRPRSGTADLSPMPQKYDHSYGVMDKWLHWLALHPATVRHLAFDLERQFALPISGTDANLGVGKDAAAGSVYVCGLARSGTTMLLRILDEIKDFRSLTYRDMPFVLAPNIWRKVTRHTKQQALVKERAHGDGILVSVDSPEGLEEVFWRTFGTQMCNPDCFGFDEPTKDVLATFADYRAIVANPRTENTSENSVLKRYLSKNNNNLLRLRSLCADPTATVLLVYRNPFATARSLHRQHQRFCISQSSDPFTRAYMGWLSHYEFGLDHLPFCFALSEMSGKYSPTDLNYWLDYWNAVYRYVLSLGDLGYCLVSHDALRVNPSAALTKLFEVLDVSADVEVLAQQIAAPDAETRDGFSPELINQAAATYLELLESSKNIFLVN